MCIALVSTAHPRYAFILASNRDEFLDRPTAQADWWDAPNTHVLAGRDLERPIRGTWLGITRQGRIACLTNYREPQTRPSSELKSRGAIVLSYLTTPPERAETTADAAQRIVEHDGIQDVGGFSLLLGQLRRPEPCGRREPLAIISNRTSDAEGVTWVAGDVTKVFGLSNSRFGDETWPKVREGQARLSDMTTAGRGQAGSEEELVQELMDLLSLDTLPKRAHGQDWETYSFQLRKSIFIPRLRGSAIEPASDVIHAAEGEEETPSTISTPRDVYGTQKQTVILVDHDGHVTFVERTLYAGPEHVATRRFEFDVEGW